MKADNGTVNRLVYVHFRVRLHSLLEEVGGFLLLRAGGGSLVLFSHSGAQGPLYHNRKIYII